MNQGRHAREYSPEQLLARAARDALKLTQPRFAALIQTPVGTMRDWEQGRHSPPDAVRVLCRLAIENPVALLDMMNKTDR